MTSNKSKRHFYPVYYFLKAYPLRSVFVVSALLSSGLAEAVSFAAMIPLLGMALLQNNEDKEIGFESIMSMVASKGGVTEKALETMKENGFKTIVSNAIKMAIERSKELGK